MKRIVSLLVGLLLVGFSTIPVLADVPALPHAFYGAVEINNNLAPTGTIVKAIGTGVKTGIAGNPITVAETGKYGGPGGLDPKLVVQGDIEEGATITFYVNDVSTGLTAEWHSGEVTELPLSVTIAPSAPGRGAAAPRIYVETSIFGIEASFRISSTGEILETIEVTSDAGDFTITIPEGTIALDAGGDPLSTLTVELDLDPPDPPEGAHIIGIPYKLGPSGATFDPAITIKFTVDPATLPPGIDVEDLVIAYYDEVAGEWVELPTTYDPATNTFTADVDHFTTFAIITIVPVVTPPVVAPAAFTVSSLGVSPSKVAPSEEVTINVLVANTGGKSGSYTVVLKIDGVKEAEERVTVAAGSSQTVTFSVTKEEAGSYTVTVDGLSGSFTVVAPLLAPAAFSVSYLSVSRLEVEPGETVTITVLVANTGGESGSYTVVLKIDGVKEAEERVTVAAGESLDATFSVTREKAGSYTVTVDGLSGSFTVVGPPGINWLLIGGIIAGVVVVGLLIFFVLRRRRAY